MPSILSSLAFFTNLNEEKAKQYSEKVIIDYIQTVQKEKNFLNSIWQKLGLDPIVCGISEVYCVGLLNDIGVFS